MVNDQPERDRLTCPPTGAAIGRRAALAGAVALCAELGALPARTQMAPESTRTRPQPGDLLVRMDDDSRRPLAVSDVPIGEKPMIAWPFDAAGDTLRSGSRLNKVLVLRLDPDGFDPQTREFAANGVLGYSAICPHTGCEVSNWQAEPQLLECPCHYSHYDPKAGAKVLSGPSPRRLAALPLKAQADGRLAVAQPFVGRVGFQQQL